jgi:hypothetical protein
MLGVLLIVAVLADVLPLGVGGRRGGLLDADLSWPFGLPALARLGEGKNQGAPSGRRLPPEGVLCGA